MAVKPMGDEDWKEVQKKIFPLSFFLFFLGVFDHSDLILVPV
jgi:hypothetical protein